MGTVTQINIKNRTYYFYNHIIDPKNLNQTCQILIKKSYKNIGIYNIGYITVKKNDDCKNINRVNPLYLCIIHANRYIEEKGVKKYLVFDSKDENKELLKKYSDVFNGVKNEIKTINGAKKMIMKKIT